MPTKLYLLLLPERRFRYLELLVLNRQGLLLLLLVLLLCKACGLGSECNLSPPMNRVPVTSRAPLSAVACFVGFANEEEE